MFSLAEIVLGISKLIVCTAAGVSETVKVLLALICRKVKKTKMSAVPGVLGTTCHGWYILLAPQPLRQCGDSSTLMLVEAHVVKCVTS